MRDFDPADQRRGLPTAVRGLYGLLRQGHRVYVHCTAGINRSPLVVLTYLTLVEGIGLEEAMTLLLRARPEVCPTWEAYHGCRQELTAQYEERIRQRAGELGGRDREPVIQPASAPRPDTAFEDGHTASIPFPAALAEAAENA